LHLAAESSELRVTKLKVTELEAERLRTQAEFNRLKLEFAELKQAASSVATEKVVADSELKLLRLEIAELETVVSNAATEKAVVGKATTLIESNVQKLTSANKQLEASVASLTSENTKLVAGLDQIEAAQLGKAELESKVQKLTSANEQLEASVVSLTSENTKLVAGLDRIKAAQHGKAEKKIPASSTTQASAQQSATATAPAESPGVGVPPPRVPKSAVRHTIQSHTLDDDDAAEQKALDKAAAQSSHSQGNASKAATARSSATSTRPVTATACFSANLSPQTNSTLSKDASHKRTPAAEDTTELPSPKRTSSRHNGAVVGFADNASATTAIHAVWQGGVQPEPPHTWDEQMYVDIPGAESLTHREQIVRKLKQHPYLVSQLAVTNFKHMLLEEDIYEVVVTAASLIPATPQECAFLATKCCRAPYSSAVGFCIVCKIREPDCMKHPARVDPCSSELLSDLLVCYPHDRPLPGHDSLQGWPELVKLVSLGALQQMIATLEKPPPPPPTRTPKDPRTPLCGIIFEELRQHYAKSTQPALYHPEDKCGACNERMLWRMPHVDPTHRCAGSGCSLPLHGSGVCRRVLGESPVMYCSEKCRRNP
jgi:myosin heavy subunit